MASASTPNTGDEPLGFFSLPRELRDDIYDILHQHEQEVNTERLSFRFPLTHIRHISRRFRTECGQRNPAISRIVISQRQKDCLDPDTLQLQRPRRTLLGRALNCNSLEFNANLGGEHGDEPWTLLWDFHFVYGALVDKILSSANYLAKTTRHGDVHLRLCLGNIGNIDRLRSSMPDMNPTERHCTKISLVLYSEGDDVPNEESLSRAQTLVAWNKDASWDADEPLIRQLCADYDRREKRKADEAGWS